MSSFPLYNVYKKLRFFDGVVFFTQVYDWSTSVRPCAAYHEPGFCSLDSSYQSMRSTGGCIVPEKLNITPIAVFEISVKRKYIPVHEFVGNIYFYTSGHTMDSLFVTYQELKAI